MQFFTSPDDLKNWVRAQKSAEEASMSLIEVAGKNEEKDIVDTCRAIFTKENSGNAAEVLFGVLSKHNITQIREGKMKEKIIREAQAVMRQDALYSNMDMRICPKLPKQSAGHGLISTYNCRHYCLDGIVFDDDPSRVYCHEAMWRRHIMDKFSREFKDKNGKWVGGYINQRFQVFTDDGGNQMELAHGERTRKPRPHQYSIERRLSEGRGEETSDLTASSKVSFVKLASIDTPKEKDDNYQMFDDIIEMKQSGLNEEDIISKVAEHYNVDIPRVACIHKAASAMMERYNGIVYAHDVVEASKTDSKIVKTAQVSLPEKSTLVTKKDMQIKIVDNGQESILKMETPVVIVSNGENPVFHVTGGPAAGVNFTLKNANDAVDGFGIEDEGDDKIQDAAEELGLNDSSPSAAETDEFPVVEA